MDKPADPATPFGEVYQAFFDDLTLEGTKPTTIARYRYNIVRYRAFRALAGRDGPADDPGVSRAVGPVRLSPAPRDAAAAAARVASQRAPSKAMA